MSVRLPRWTAFPSGANVPTMIDPKLFDDLSQRLAASVPKGVQLLQEDLSRNFRGVIEAGLARLDLVTARSSTFSRRCSPGPGRSWRRWSARSPTSRPGWARPHRAASLRPFAMDGPCLSRYSTAAPASASMRRR